MNSSDIKFYHSGGGSNCNPLNDLGGACSTCELVDGINTLFSDLSPKASRSGGIDYRCFYVKNTHPNESLRNAKFYVDWERKSGSFVDVGVKRINEVQTIHVQGLTPPNENNFFTLHLDGYTNWTIPYSANITEWQGMFQVAIRSVDGLQNVLVQIAGSIGFPTDIVFTITFTGHARNHKLNLMTVVDNSLDNQTITVTEVKDGSPINVVACTTSSIIVKPSCVDFDYPLRGSPIELGDLLPGEQFPVWVRRTTPEGTRVHIKDKIRFNVDGTFP